MSPLSSAQELFLRSSLAGAIEKGTENSSLTLTRDSGHTVLLQMTFEADEPLLRCEYPQKGQTIHLTPEEAVTLALQHLAEPGTDLVTDDGEKKVQWILRGDKVVRETVQPDAPILKNPLWSIGKATHLDPNKAAPLLKAIGLMTPEGEIKAPMRRKFKQVNHFLDLMIPLLKTEKASGSFTLVDCGCGKSYLSFVLFWYLRKVMKKPAVFYGVDVSSKMMERSRGMAQDLGLPEMEFQCSRILEANLPDKIDLLVSLHACDTATDEALAQGVAHRARNIVCVPCCQHEIADQIEGVPMYPLKKHGIFTHRFGDLLTDMLRALFLEAHGYAVTAGEFVSAEDTPKNLMLRAVIGNSAQHRRYEQYQEFKNYYRVSPSIDFFLHELEAGNKRS